MECSSRDLLLHLHYFHKFRLTDVFSKSYSVFIRFCFKKDLYIPYFSFRTQVKARDTYEDLLPQSSTIVQLYADLQNEYEEIEELST